MITKGNSKLGKNVWHVNLPPGESCPGMSDFCDKVCYAKKAFRMYPNVRTKYSDNLDLWNSDPEAWEALLHFDLAKLPDGGAFRWHVSGDIMSVEYAEMIARTVDAYPKLRFWLYTRSYVVFPEAVEKLRLGHDNLRVWYSTDESMPVQDGVLEARVFDTREEATSEGYMVCPEQTGKRESCEMCGLCFDIKKDTFKLAFVTH